MTLMACNLLVIVTYLYCLFWKEEGDDEITEQEEASAEPRGGACTDLGQTPFTIFALTEISESGLTSFGTYRLSRNSDNVLESMATSVQNKSGTTSADTFDDKL